MKSIEKNPLMNKLPPMEETRLTAAEIRKHALRIIEKSMKNDWNGVIDECRSGALLASHCKEVEKGFR